MKTYGRIGLLAFVMTAFSMLALWNCNLSTPEEAFFLKVSLHDSLSVEKGKYDTIEVDLLDTNGNPIQTRLFFETYELSDSVRLAKLPLAVAPPQQFTVRITAHAKGSDAVWILSSTVVNGNPQPLVLTFVPGSNTGGNDSTRVSIVSPRNGPLYIGDSIDVAAQLNKPGTMPEWVWTSSNATVAALSPSGKLVALSAGDFTLKVSSLSDTGLHDQVNLSVLPQPTDLPESIEIVTPNPLTIKVGDASVALEAKVIPATAKQTVVWTLPTSDIAVLEVGNKIRALKPGQVKVAVSSTIAPTVFAMLDVTVEQAAITAPDTIEFLMPVPMALAPTDAPSPILWRVLPTGVNQGVVWTSTDTSIAQVTADNKIKPVKVGKAKITGISQVQPNLKAEFEVNVIKAVKVDSITLNRKSMKLYTGGEDGQLNVTLFGTDTGAQYSLSSSDLAVATVSGTGSVEGLKPGTALIKASIVGFPDIFSLCTVTVVTDTPSVTLTANQTVAYGGEAVFQIKVTQEYGSVAEIKADMDGNGVFERTLLGIDTATFRSNYNQVKVFTLNFQVKDSEGNTVNLTRLVTVTPPPAPTVQITDPATAITVNTPTYTVKFTVQDPTQAADESKDSLVTLSDGANTIRVSRTNAGGTGSAQVVITLDRTAPGTPIFVAQAAMTADNTPTWSWGAVTGAVKYQVRLNDSAFAKTTGTIDLTTLTYTPAALLDGTHTLYVRSLDGLGNASSSASQSLTVDTRPPAAVSFTGIDSSYTASSTPTWTWTPSATNSGTGVYVLKLDAGAEFDWTSASFTPTTALSDNAIHTLTVREKDQVPGVTGAAKSFSYRVKVNPPSAPNVRSAANVANNGLTNNPGFAWTSGGGGNGRYRVRINSETTYRVNGVAQTTWSVPATEADGIYTIRVSEQDDMGRWGTEGNFTINLDRTGPVYTEVRILGSTFDLRDGYITNAASLVISYKADAASKQFTCNLAQNNASNSCSAVNTDAAGNSSTLLRNIWRRSNVIFFTITGQGARDGSSWENARGDLVDFVNSTTGSEIDGKDLWIASGDYSAKSINTQNKWCRLFGGFTASNFPTDISGRINYSTFLGEITLLATDGAAFDGLTIKGITAMTSEISFTNCRFTSSIYFVMGVNINLFNCEAIDIDGNDAPALNIASEVVWDGGRISSNNPAGANYPIEVSAKLTLKGSLVVTGNSGDGVWAQIHNRGNLIIENSVTMDCLTIYNEGGTVSCKE